MGDERHDAGGRGKERRRRLGLHRVRQVRRIIAIPPAARLLIVAPHDIATPATGAELRSYHLARQLSGFFDVTYLCFRREPGGGAERSVIQGLGTATIQLCRIPRPPAYQIPHLVRGLFGRIPVTVLNYESREMDDALDLYLRDSRFDFVQIENIHMASYLERIRSHANAPRALVYDWHNLESELMRRFGLRAGNPWRRLYALQTAPKIRAVERRVLRQCDAHLAVSERDRRLLLALEPKANVHVASNGVDVDYYADTEAEDSEQERKRFRVLYVGSMDYHANIDAVDSFARDAWPLLHRAAPELVFTVVGKSPPEALRRRLERIAGVEVAGTVPDVRPYYRQALTLVVPLRVGSGTRLKILESMAAGVPVISTVLGAEGLLARPGSDFLIAESAEEFRDGVVKLREDSPLARRLAESALDLVRRQYDWSITGGTLRAVYTSLR